MAEQPAGTGAGGKPPARLGDRFEIYPDRPLPELRSAFTPAFAAVDRENSTSLFAVVCEPDLVPRHDVLKPLHGLRSEAVLLPVHWGVLDWPPAARRSFVILFERPGGGPMLPPTVRQIEALHEDVIMRHVLPPIVAALRKIFSLGLTHRSIRPGNLFYRDATRRVVMLGECVSAPPAAGQPLAYETVESAMAMPIARGPGTPADDLYALGATLLFLLTGHHPAADLNDDQLLRERLTRGSYAALIGGERVHGTIMELLRGLLSDDARERWQIEDVEMWLEGRRTLPKQPTPTKRAGRPLEFGGSGYSTARTLAHAFHRDPSAAARTVNDPDFAIWMQRSLGDEERSKMVAAALSEGRDGASGPAERLTARIAIALDPPAPIRYKSIAAHIDGLGYVLIAAFRGRLPQQEVAELLGGRLPQFWFSMQPNLLPEQVLVLKHFERLRGYLDERRPGFGMERILYDLNPRLHCLSAAIEADHVVDAGELLPALERASKPRTGEEFLLDRHLAAFVAARFAGGGGDWFDAVGSAEPAQRALGVLYLLARLQSTGQHPALPALTQRVARSLTTVIERYHSRARRSHLRAELPRVVAKGSLIELLTLVDNAAERQRDAVGFFEAQREYANIVRRLVLLRIEAPRRPQRAVALGGRYAAASTGVLALLIAMIAVAALS